MGQLCCTSRVTQPPANLAAGAGGQGRRVAAPGDGSVNRILSRSFSKEGEEATITIEYKSDSGDADTFDRAFKENDIATLAGLLASDEAVEYLVEPKHPWAEDPCTIGALAAMQLAILSSMVAKDDPGMKMEIGRAAIAKLVTFLGSPQEDRVQAAIVALNYLTDCSENAHEAFRTGAMPSLIALMGSTRASMRGAVASTLKNICTESEEYCENFMRLGGIRGFVSQLDVVVCDPYVASDPYVDSADLALEAVWNLEEVMTDKGGKPIARYAQLAMEEGAVEKLERLSNHEDQEVSVAASKVLAVLTQTKETSDEK